MPTTFAVRIIQVHIARREHSSGVWRFLTLRRSPEETVFPNIWQVVTGSIEDGETPQQTAFRELQEETSLITESLWVLPFVGNYFDAPRNIMNFVPCFGAIVEENAEVILSHEHSDYAWLTKEELQSRLVIPSHKEACEHFYHSILLPIEQGETPVFVSILNDATK